MWKPIIIGEKVMGTYELANITHPSFPQPKDPGVWLWRYMDISKFAALLQKRALFFSRADLLGDPFEGSMPAPNVKVLETIRLVRRHTPDDDPYKGMSDDQLLAMFQALSQARRRAVKWHYINCWHMNESESAAMWKLYSQSSDAVCIRTDYKTLADALPEDCYLGIVGYVDFLTTPIASNNMFAPFMVKRRSFAHEREARGIFTEHIYMHNDNPPPIKQVPIDINGLVKQVFVSPEASNWFKDVVEELSRKYDLRATVEHSEMNAIPLY